MSSVKHTEVFEVDLPIEHTFPLFSPEGEKAWVPGWDYENVMATTQLCEDYVFLTQTHDHATADAVWIVKRYEPEKYLVEFYKIEPADKLGVVVVKCRDLGSDKAEVCITYKYIALSERGERFIATFTKDVYADFIGKWKSLLLRYTEGRG